MSQVSQAARWLCMILAALSGCSLDERSVRTATGASSGRDGEGPARGAAGSSSGAQSNTDGTTGIAPGPAEAAATTGNTTPNAGDLPSSAELAQASFTASWVGDGEGSVSVSVQGGQTYECTQPCTVPAAPGSVVTVTAVPRPYTVVRGWSEPGCGAQLTCTLTAQAGSALSLEFQLRYQVAFATSETYLPSQLPRPGQAANDECTRLAKAAGYHGNRWVAWLSSSNGTAETADDVHAIEQFQHTGGWLRPDGVPVARSLAALARGELLAPILLATRTQVARFAAWSSTGADGRLLAQPEPIDCSGWSSDDGAVQGRVAWTEAMAGPRWDGGNVELCSEQLGLVCLGDDADEEVELAALEGRLVFLSEGSFSPGMGVAAADALCQQEACAALLTDCDATPGSARTFLSYLHTPSRRAWQRFDLSGPTWLRSDGLPWLASAAELARDAAGASVPPGVVLGPRYGVGPGAMWIGEAAGTSTCDDWASSSGTGAIAFYDVPAWSGLGNLLLPNGYVSISSCSEALPVLCLEQ